MKKIVALNRVLAAFFFTLISLNVLAQSNKVAIPEVVDKEGNVSYAICLMVRSNLTKAISEKQGYAAYDRVDIGAIMDEHSFQRTGLVDDRTIRKLGEMTGCNLVLIAEIAIIDSENYYVSAKMLEIETAKTKQIESTLMGSSASSIQKGCDELVGKLLGTTKSRITTSTTSTPPRNKAIVLSTGLRVFPYDIGEFNAEPYQTIRNLNQNNSLGYNNWRLPTRDELSLLRTNASSLGDFKNEQYMVSNPQSGQIDEISYGGSSGWVRLVSDGWSPSQLKQLKERAIREICGITSDYIIDYDLGLIFSPDIRLGLSEMPYSAPSEWRLASIQELIHMEPYLSKQRYHIYVYFNEVEKDKTSSYVGGVYTNGVTRYCYYICSYYPYKGVYYPDKDLYAVKEPMSDHPLTYDSVFMDGRSIKYSEFTLLIRIVRPIPSESTINQYLQKYY